MKHFTSVTCSILLSILLAGNLNAAVRVFMAGEGEESTAPPTGNTSLIMAPGTTARVGIWMEDTSGTPTFGGYQILIRWESIPEPGATGLVDYVNVVHNRCAFFEDPLAPYALCNPADPSACGGNPVECGVSPSGSFLIDLSRPDWVFDGITNVTVAYNETDAVDVNQSGFGGIGAPFLGGSTPIAGGLFYFAEFEIAASGDAIGEHVLHFVPAGAAPSGGAFLSMGNGQELAASYQSLTIQVQPVCGDNLLHGSEACDPPDGVFCDNNCALFPVVHRVFMSTDSGLQDAPATGETDVWVAQGGSTRVSLWLNASVPAQELNFYQIIMPWTLAPQLGASGVVGYRDTPNPGGSVFVDQTRADYAFANMADNPPVYHETPGLGFGVIGQLAGLFDGVTLVGDRYLGEFIIEASADASGDHQLSFVPIGGVPVGGTSIGSPGATQYSVDEFQDLTVSVSTQCGNVPAAGIHVCGDLDPSDGIRDSACAASTCNPGTLICESDPVAFADLGGPFGDCATDGFANVHDSNLALLCFASQSSCSDISQDAGGPFGDCEPDGFCNIHDANHALAAFSNESLCTCPPAAGPAPEASHSVVDNVTIEAQVDRREARPGDRVAVRVFMDAGVRSLQSYQLEQVVSGGTQGRLELVEIEVEPRRDAVFARRPGVFDAYNLVEGRMLAGLMAGGVQTSSNGYLATFVYEVSKDAAGTFVVDLGGSSESGAQTFLVASWREEIAWTSNSERVTIESPAKNRK